MFFLQTFFRRAANPTRKSEPKVEEFVCRNERKTKRADHDPLRVKKRVHFESRPSDQSGIGIDQEASRSVDGDKVGTQVKILVTKEEAARLLLKCRDGGILELKDVAQIPRSRSDAVPSATGRGV